MRVEAHSPTDIAVLKRKALVATNAKQRDRYRAVAMALEGLSTEQIMYTLGRSKNFVQRWTYFYRDGGIEAIRPTPQNGRPTRLPPDDSEHFKQRGALHSAGQGCHADTSKGIRSQILT
jgi:transposase